MTWLSLLLVLVSVLLLVHLLFVLMILSYVSVNKLPTFGENKPLILFTIVFLCIMYIFLNHFPPWFRGRAVGSKL